MKRYKLPADPFNVIITGVGGQGNVMASRVLGNMLSDRGFTVTIGETFGASQRGGSVMSHLRISGATTWSPQIPRGRAHVVVALEPTEAVRVLADYGNPGTRVLCNTRPIYPAGVLSGAATYPTLDELKMTVAELSGESWFLDATGEALKMGNPILGNIMMIAALVSVANLPLERRDFERIIAKTMSADKTAVNLTAWDLGRKMIR
jgi:indolepyruvate ferredoxin oxidoreductase beta subunit